MKQLILVLGLFAGSAYSMFDPKEEIQPAVVSEPILKQPDESVWLCPYCDMNGRLEGVEGAMVCEGCKKRFEYINVEGTSQDGKKAMLRFWFIKLK